VLKLDRNAISTDKSFLELGGHSLSAIQIANRIKKSFSTEIKLMDMFQRQTVRQQAEFITTNEWLHRGASTVSETKKFEIKIG
jgi:surfactin family lipopeptide synthetase A